jgi:hypothetical protein
MLKGRDKTCGVGAAEAGSTGILSDRAEQSVREHSGYMLALIASYSFVLYLTVNASIYW